MEVLAPEKVSWSEEFLWGDLCDSFFQPICPWYSRTPFSLILLSLASLVFCAPEFLQICSWMDSAPPVFVSALSYFCCFSVPLPTQLLLLCHSRCSRNIWNSMGSKELGYWQKQHFLLHKVVNTTLILFFHSSALFTDSSLFKEKKSYLGTPVHVLFQRGLFIHQFYFRAKKEMGNRK